MKRLLAILVCKLLKFLGNIIGRGSSFPGKIALKICPDVLSKISLPNCVIAVTGSNGKTSTVEMIAKVFSDTQKTFSYNREGSNQIEGVATFVLNDCNILGKFKKDAIIMETDERFAKYTFKFFSPSHYLILNLYRDQLTRNGHPDFVYNCILESIKKDTKLILNANDPLVSTFANFADNVSYFSVDRTEVSTELPLGVYRDYKYCPLCSSELIYDFYHYGEIGSFHCSKCDYSSSTSEYRVTEINFDDKFMVINDTYKINLRFCNLYTAFNTLAAFAICSEVGIKEESVSKSLSNYEFHSGRVIDFKMNSFDCKLLISKHENSVSYDQSIDIVVKNQGSNVSLLIIVDAVSRKYFTGEISWLWDINFEALDCSHIEKIFLSGTYCYDLLNRFSYSGVDPEKIKVIPKIDDCVEYLKGNLTSKLFVITCFSDKDKFLSKLT